MANVISRGRGYSSNFVVNGKRIMRFMDTDERRAQRKSDELEEQMRGLNGPATSGMSWPEFKVRVIDELKGVRAPETLREYSLHMRHVERILNGKLKRLADLNPSALQVVYSRRLEEGALVRAEEGNLPVPHVGSNAQSRDGKSGAFKTVRVIKTLLHLAERRGWRPREDWKIEGLTNPKSKRRALTNDELAKLAERFKGYHKTALAVAYAVGVRPQELYYLHRSDVDFARNLIHIREADFKIMADGRLWKLKTENSKRDLPMSNGLRSTLALHFERPEIEWVVQNTEDLYRPTYDGFLTYMAREMKAAGVPGTSIYWLRHTAITRAWKGSDLKTASAMAGHSDVTITANIYTHADEETMQKAIDAIPGSPLLEGPKA